MRPQVITQSSVAASAWIPLDYKQNPFQVSFGCVISGGPPTYTVEHTFDDILGGATATAFPHSSVAAQTTNKDGNYAFPITGIRINMTAGTGSVTMTVHNPSAK
jgi:hypothetical protein